MCNISFILAKAVCWEPLWAGHSDWKRLYLSPVKWGETGEWSEIWSVSHAMMGAWCRLCTESEAAEWGAELGPGEGHSGEESERAGAGTGVSRLAGALAARAGHCDDAHALQNTHVSLVLGLPAHPLLSQNSPALRMPHSSGVTWQPDVQPGRGTKCLTWKTVRILPFKKK